MPLHTRDSRTGSVTILGTSILARIGRRYLLAVCGALFAFAFWALLSVSLRPLEPATTSASGRGPDLDGYSFRSLSWEAVRTPSPPRDDE
jgi:hypothetical protein